MDQVMATLKTKYATFTGRARRREFWYFVLFSFIVGAVASVVDGLLFGNYEKGPIQALAGLALLCPSLAVGFRRLHDTERSGWWLLLWLIPFLGWAVLIYFYVQPGTVGPNKFGDDPKAGDAPAASPIVS